jgi:NAD+ synthase/NAD+ synthase (glutamine-hydrolysing)
MKIALAQINPIVGDIHGNCRKIADCIARAADLGAELAVFCELSVLGYPPRDLLRKKRFIADSVEAVGRLAGKCENIAALVGFVRPTPGGQGRPLQNAAAFLAGGRVQSVLVKSLLPTYDVFDETRYFEPAAENSCVHVAGASLGVSICEDIWDAAALGRDLYGVEPISALASAGAKVIVNMAASPFEMGKSHTREGLFRRQAARTGTAIVYVNQVGGNDELIFDGGSCVVGPDGQVAARAKSFTEDLLVVDLESLKGRREPLGDEMARLSSALKLGLRDYVTKCGFGSVVLGLSGGIDSAVVATLAADALGGENVFAIAMPSRYSSGHSLSDARTLAGNLGIHLHEAPIEAIHSACEQSLGRLLAGGRLEVAHENIQARIRGAIVMAASNAFGHLALATGNKSELSTGYCTLYGDMCGGLDPIGDVLKTTVYKLAEQLNAEVGCQRISQSIMVKAPSAELKPNQVDQDKLPPYDLLDEILARYVEADETVEAIIAQGFDAGEVRRVVSMVDLAEFKRRQAAPVLKVTPRAFGTGRRMPIAQKYVPAGDE